jgi:hypothetical protein
MLQQQTIWHWQAQRTIVPISYLGGGQHGKTCTNTQVSQVSQTAAQQRCSAQPDTQVPITGPNQAPTAAQAK